MTTSLAKTGPDLQLATHLLERLRDLSFDGVGITRDTYGEGEQRAHDLFKGVAADLGLEIRVDAALNLYMTLPGADRTRPAVMTGSHLDSVPKGGNYDGAAGVVAGMAVLAGWARAGLRPQRDVTVMGIRAEESAWFPVSYIGSKAAFGLLTESDLRVRRFDTGRPLRDHMADCAGRPDLLVSGPPYLDPAKIDCFLELHIEQGPVLAGSAHPLGIVTGICGSLRYRQAKVVGRYAHSGATPRTYRSDAVVALSTLIAGMQARWEALESAGHEFTLTFGQVNTEAGRAEISKVSGQVDCCVDIRSRSPETLKIVDAELRRLASTISARYDVTFEWGSLSGSLPAFMDEGLRGELDGAARALGLAPPHMPSGAGHDAANFSSQGVPAAMLFVRNANGSHNPDEAMELDDFFLGVRTLGSVLANRAGRG